MKNLGDPIMILDLRRQGLKLAMIARQLGIDSETVRKYIAVGLDWPSYGLRQPRERLIDDHLGYLRSRLETYPGLTAQRLTREISERGYAGGYSVVRDTVRDLPPPGGGRGFAVRFETPPGRAGAGGLRPVPGSVHPPARDRPDSLILTSNCGLAEWGEIFGSPVVATALLDRLLHHAIVIQIDGSSYRLRRHADPRGGAAASDAVRRGQDRGAASGRDGLPQRDLLVR